METSSVAYFSSIQEKIKEQINRSQTSIKVAVAWFTNKELLGLLKDKVESQVKVEIIVSDDIINKIFKPETNAFKNAGGFLSIYPSASGKFLHDKFAIFDDNVVITGSYNWTIAAEKFNQESIIVLQNHKTIVDQFNGRFKKLKSITEDYFSFYQYSLQNENAAIAEEKWSNLEKELEKEFISSSQEAHRLGVKSYFDFIGFIVSHGAVGAAKKLMKGEVQSGFVKMWEKNRLDLTCEGIITKVKYRILFDENTLKNAENRLNQYRKPVLVSL